ncbi:unnamed protein product [Arctia plantaginis]|uniref:Transmembrane protein n=1 Tax=Arctia plantaginis TaxID=874455 RepID=A0A8S0Z0Z5_ARCPL|nr:unnamed protein product [Arctia plantaginis]
MNTPTNIKYPQNLVLIASLSGGLTIGISLVYILLCVTFIVFHFNCDALSSTTSAGYFWQTIFKVYGLSSSCEEEISIQRLTQESTVLILVACILAITVICLIAAIGLVAIVQDENQSHHISWLVYTYVVSCCVALILDITTATHFGMDFDFLTSLLRELAPNNTANYQIDVIRQGALILMIIVMKGFIGPLINCIFLVLLLIHVVQYQNLVKNSEHPIHKVGALNAFDQKKDDENWVNPDMFVYSSPFSRGPQINSAFVDDDSPPRSPVRRLDPSRSDYQSNRSSDRSDSWTRPKNIPQNGRAFSYLSDIRRPMPPKIPHSPSPAPGKSSPWRRDPWPQAQAPPVPAPDYSPTQPRRLKSALKPGYM